MADQNQRISDLLDALTDASSEEIETALRIFEPADVAAVVAERALAGGGGSGGSSAATDILVVEWRGSMTDCSKNSDGVVPQFADFTVDYLKGTDLSLVDDSDAPGAAAFVSAAGGSFGIQTYMGLRLTADAGSAVQRFIQFYTSNPYGFPIPDLGSDLLLPLIDGYTIDTSCTSLPYFDVAAGQAFGKPSFFGAAGVAADTVALLIIMTCWSM